ncbi:MAG: hypothetical protein IID45_14825, partial [Planctomycetes bacterium]|nr:hypothetical protein [Planctomycetota bacterium]
LFELIRAYRASPELASLLPGKRGRVRGERRLPSEQEDLISRALREVYLTAEKPNMASVRRWLRHECLKAGVPIPSLKALRARIVALPQKDIIAAREGAKAASDRFRPVRTRAGNWLSESRVFVQWQPVNDGTTTKSRPSVVGTATASCRFGFSGCAGQK